MQEEKRSNIIHSISTEIQKNDFMSLEKVAILLFEYGIDSKFYLEEGLKSWFRTNFPEFEIQSKKGWDMVVFSNEEVDNKKNDEIIDYSILDKLYDKKNYEGYLSSKILEKIEPSELPMTYIEKAVNCAHHLLYPESKENIVLNEFQKELIRATSTYEFVKKWKIKDRFSEHMAVLCAESAIADLEFPVDITLISKLLNNVGYLGGYHNDYAGIINRLVSCENKLVPHFYVIRLFVYKSKKMVQKCLSEYCQLVKDLKKSATRAKIVEEDRMYSFSQIIRIIKMYMLDETFIPYNVRTNIVSVYVENNKIKELSSVIPMWDAYYASLEWKLVDLYLHPELWNEQEFKSLLDEKVSEELLQRFLALLWEQHADENEIPMYLLKMFSWVILYNGYASMDEILRYHYNSNFTKLQKQIMLLNSYPSVCLVSENDLNMYVLASYIALCTYQDIHENKISITVKQNLQGWSAYSQTYFQNIITEYGKLRIENLEQYVKLFTVFQLDVEHYLDVQKVFAQWYISKIMKKGYTPYEYLSILDTMFINGAYEAYLQLYDIVEENQVVWDDKEKRVRQYSEALIHLQRYKDAIEYLQNNAYITSKYRDEMLLRVITENFRVHGLSSKAHSIFGENFTYSYAISMLLEQLQNNRFAVNPLIALYCHSYEYHKVLYLYSMYQAKFENGYTRLYSQVRSKLGTYSGKIHNHYDVIEMTFSSLDCDSLVEFFKWAKNIPIPEIKAYKPTHVFAYYFDLLLANPLQENNWISFLNHIVKRSDLNAWLVCVCETVFRKKISCNETVDLEVTMRNTIQKLNSEKLPRNFLPYMLTYIMDYGDFELCQDVVEVLKEENVLETIVYTNIWFLSYTKIMEKCKTFCADMYSKTGEDTYQELLTILEEKLDVQQWEKVIETKEKQQQLIAKICENYRLNQNKEEVVNFLNQTKWENLSVTDKEVLKLLQLIVADQETGLLAEKNPYLDKECISQFRQDCLEILRTYPKKDGLLQFEKKCTNSLHKLRVYSYVLGALYDNDIYGSYELKYEDLNNADLYNAYLAFLKKAYAAQLEYHKKYMLFYKRWRYLKMYIINVLQNDAKVEDTDDADIIACMKEYNHYDAIYEDVYIPFKRNVASFFQFTNMSMIEKKYFCMCLLQGKMEDYLNSYAETIKNLSKEQKQVIRMLVACLDYREINYAFYCVCWDKIQCGAFHEVLELAEGISDYAYDSIQALKEMPKRTKALEVFQEVALQEKPHACLNEVVRMEMETFMEMTNLLIPVMCSRQFIPQIYNRLRSNIIQYPEENFDRRYKALQNYLEKKDYEDAMIMHTYLCAFRACMRKNKEEMQEIIEKYNLKDTIPTPWKREVSKMITYAKNTKIDFIPSKIQLP